MATKNFVREKISKGYAGSILVKIAREELAKIAASKPPQPVDIESVWQPHAGRQTEFWTSTAREVLFGGAAGGGKSACLTAHLLKHSHLPGCLSVVFRRDTTQFQDLHAKSRELFPKLYKGLEPVQSPYFVWTFPSGATAHYRHCQHEKDVAKFDGWEINCLDFDELTHFTETQYLGLCARVRTSKPGYPTQVRATTNPGGEGHDWVFRRWGAWLDPDFTADGLTPRFDEYGKKLPPAAPAEILWIRKVNGKETYYREDPGFATNPALSRTFIPALLSDNPSLADGSPEYLAQLEELDPVRRKQLKEGDWLVKPAAGLYFKSIWPSYVDAHEVPTTGVKLRIRAWDLASTENPEHRSEVDWTVGLKMTFTADAVYIEDVERHQLNPAGVKELIRRTAQADGRRVAISIPQDPGQAGKSQVHDFSVDLRGYTLITERPTGDKVTRFSPFSAYAEPKADVRKVFLVRAPWNKAFVGELEAFPTKGIHDDQVDAASDAFNHGCTLMRRRRHSGGLEVVESSDR